MECKRLKKIWSLLAQKVISWNQIVCDLAICLTEGIRKKKCGDTHGEMGRDVTLINRNQE